jgi:FlaA1/EpsC-like NDP-sugar epimerase/lipopolysaccharide/colanic/teichoic acid biosynthesis glycosyltransferase
MIPFRKMPRLGLLVLGYAAAANLAYMLSLLLRFEGQVPESAWLGYRSAAPAFTLLTLVAYYVAGLFHGLWRYAGTFTLFQIVKGATLSALGMVAILLFTREALFPRSLIVMVWAGQLLLVGAARVTWLLGRNRALRPDAGRPIRTLIVGADSAGVHLVQEMGRRRGGRETLVPVGFIDEDQRLTGRLVEGVKVQGTIADLPRTIQQQQVEMVIVSDARMPAPVVRKIARYCVEANVRVKTLPGLSDLHAGRPTLSQVRDVRIEDLLGRRPVDLDLEEVADLVRGVKILVTGAGGSIGSELARQAAAFGPSELVLLDHAENGLYFVHHELVAQYPGLRLQPLVADIQDLPGMEAVFSRYRPTVVLHAAAHKHVPLLELNPREAVLNNIVGTRILVDAADRHGVSKFVLVSTDKAVNPTSVMGASKRVCEMLLQSRSQQSQTRFVVVRFGNVLGSDGSVVPLFQRQLEHGGPLTVTHPDARRYFMTVPEAARLVLQASAMGRGGEVFLLEMGEPVRILDLARQLIRLAGMREGEDVEIVFTGLRPGEKLYEELHTDTERTRITRHERILVWELDARDEVGLREEVAELEALARAGAEPGAFRERLHRLVPEYRELEPQALEPVPSTPVVELPVAGETPLAPDHQGRAVARRAVDTVAAGALLVLSAPLWLVLWLEGRRRGARDVLVHESRLGRNRRRGLRRTSITAVPIDRRSYQRRVRDLPGQAFSSARFRSDLGPVGRWAARRKLDQVPRLLNVLRHEMALVGPAADDEQRALRLETLVPDSARRFTVLPGVTGLAQLSEYSDTDPEGVVRRAHYDLYYVDNRSLLLDAGTLARTFGLVFGRGNRKPQVPVHRTQGAAATQKAPSDH